MASVYQQTIEWQQKQREAKMMKVYRKVDYHAILNMRKRTDQNHADGITRNGANVLVLRLRLFRKLE